jgi:hypothetical protein
MRGWIYVLSHPAIPEMVKIGQTGADPTKRAAELFTTGLPNPFRIEYSALYDDYANLERRVHLDLSEHRISHDREFFRVDAREAALRIRKCAGSDPLFEEENFSSKKFAPPDPKELRFSRSLEKRRQLANNRIDGTWSFELKLSIPWRYEFCQVCAKVTEHAVPAGSGFWACCKCDKSLFP